MPSVSKKQQKFMGIVRSIQKGEQPASKFSKSAQKAAKKMKKSSVKKYAKTKHDDLPVKKESLSKSQIKKMRDEFDKTGELPPHLKKISNAKKEFEKKFKVKDIEIPGLEWMSKLGEAADRDYKAEYKKFQSSTKAKKYRAELNKYNRQKGTYGNGDGKDASHKGGKIVGFEKESTNRGRAEKSRLKKESVINENPAAIAAAQRIVVQNKNGKKVSVMTAKNKSYAEKDPAAHKKAKSIFQRIKDKFLKKEIDEYVDTILEDLCLCEACQKGYMTHPTRKTKIMFGKRYRNCIKKEDVTEAVYKLKRGSTNKDLDELDALLARAGFKGKPDFNKMTWSIKNKNPKIAKIIKSKGGKKIKESVDEDRTASIIQYNQRQLDKLVAKPNKSYRDEEEIQRLRNAIAYAKSKQESVDEAVSPKGWNMSKKFITILGREVKNLQKYHRQQNEEDFLEVANYMELQLKYMKKNLNEGTCGYGIDGKIGEEPAGPNLMKKIKKISKDKEKKKILKSKKEGVNEAGMELKKLEDAIKMFQKKIDKQGRVTNARDEDHLKNLIKIYKQMGGKKIKESVNERLNQSQAKTLLRQLGGNKFIMMTGAKQMSIGKDGLTMKIGRNSKSITHVAIDLDRGKDLYIMKFIRVRKGIPKVVKQYDSVYADNLNNIFEKETGLYTRL